jgi:hypothetical protein
MNEIIFIIYSCYNNLNKAKIVYNALNNNINCKIHIIYGDPNVKTKYIQDDIFIILNCADNYENLNLKSITLFESILQIYPNMKGCIKCDDDIIPNIVAINNLLDMLNKNENIEWLGDLITVNEEFKSIYHLRNKQVYNINKFNKPILVPKCKYMSGPIYYLSKKSIELFNKNKIIHEFEDVMVGQTLTYLNIVPTNYYIYSNNYNNKDIVSIHDIEHIYI